MRKSLKKRLVVASSLGLGLMCMVSGTNAFAQSSPVTSCQNAVSNHMDQFYDVSKTHYAAEALQALYNMGVAKGCSDTYFCADCSIQRQAAAVFIYRLKYNSNPVVYPEPPFTDMPTDKNSEIYKAIATLYNKGVINGSGDNKFNPTNYLKRSEAATLLSKAYMTSSQISQASSYSQSFPDVSPSSWYYDYVQALAHSCIVNGTGLGYNPDDYMSRIDFVLALARAHEVVSRCTTGKCIQSLGICGDCDPNSYSNTCHGNDIRSCVDGFFQDKVCPKGCNKNKCNDCQTTDPALCISDTQLQSCVNYSVTTTICPTSQPHCYDGACHACKGNYKKCEGDTAISCENGNLKEQDCATYGMKCEVDHCVSVDMPECTNGETQCASDGVRMSCDGGKWITNPCPPGQECIGTSCVDIPSSKICTQGESRCDTAGNRESCDNNNWVSNPCPPEQTCVGNTCVNKSSDPPKVCTENDTICDSSGVRKRCTSSEWIDAPCGANQTCSGNDCVDLPPEAECLESASRCLGKDHQVCVSGHWLDDPCEEGKQVCSGNQCMNVSECKDAEFQCDENQNRQICENGQWVPRPCSDGLVCIDNDCKVPLECTDNDTKCDGEIRMVCAGGKWKNEPCTDGKVCTDNGVCALASEVTGPGGENKPGTDIISTDSGCSQGNGKGSPLPISLLMLAGAGLLIRRRRHSA